VDARFAPCAQTRHPVYTGCFFFAGFALSGRICSFFFATREKRDILKDINSVQEYAMKKLLVCAAMAAALVLSGCDSGAGSSGNASPSENEMADNGL
jgi:hypothetical protein